MNRTVLAFVVSIACLNQVNAMACNEEQAEAAIMARYKQGLRQSKGEITKAIGAAFKYNLQTGTEYRFHAYVEGTQEVPSCPNCPFPEGGRPSFSQIVWGVTDANCNVVDINGIGGLKSLK